MSKYDTSRITTSADVSKEAAEARQEISQAASAVRAAFGSGATAEVKEEAKREVKEALAASGEAVVAAADLVADQVKEYAAKGMRFFKNKLGYTIHDPEQDKVLSPAKVTAAEMTPWMEARIKEGMVKEISAEEAEDALRGPLMVDELSGR